MQKTTHSLVSGFFYAYFIITYKLHQGECFADGTFTYARVFGKDDYKVYSTDFRNLSRMEF